MRSSTWAVMQAALWMAACGGSSVNTTDGGSHDSAGGAGGTSAGASTGGGGTKGLPQAALTFRVAPAVGKACTTTNAQLGIPSASMASVLDELTCDATRGCTPDRYVVQDRAPGATVYCSVAAQGSGYNVALNLRVDGSSTGGPSVSFGVNGSFAMSGGTISSTMGQLAINETNSVAEGGGTDPACDVTINPGSGKIEPGAIWANFVCANFRDPVDLGDTGCLVSGLFLFENCER